MHDRRKPRSVLAVGAHPDDVEIGCAGTLVQHRAVGDQVTVLVMSGGELGAQVKEGRREEALRAAEVLDTRIVLGPFFDGTIPLTSDTVDVVEGLIREHNVDTVYVHSPEDAHQDHVVTARAVLAATRKMNRVLFYQSPSTTVFHPTIFVDIEEHLARKMEASSQKTLPRQMLKNLLPCSPCGGNFGPATSSLVGVNPGTVPTRKNSATRQFKSDAFHVLPIVHV